MTHFTGRVEATVLVAPGEATRLAVYEVTFDPEARTYWHTHPHGQGLRVTSGRARVQREGEAVVELVAGEHVWIPPGVRHWHGAGPDGVMAHLAFQEAAADGTTVTWHEPVTDQTYHQHEERS